MTYEEEVDMIIEKLSGEEWVFAYRRKANDNNVEHLVKIDDIGNVISKSLCGKFMNDDIIVRQSVRKNTFTIATKFICETCLSKLQSNLNKYGFSSIDMTNSFVDIISSITFNRS